MLRVRDIMTPSVVTFASDQTLRDAVEVLVSCRIGGAPVLDGDKVVGVLSATDIIEFESITPPPDAEREQELAAKEAAIEAELGTTTAPVTPNTTPPTPTTQPPIPLGGG